MVRRTNLPARMRVLLDTHVLLWAFETPRRIPGPVQDLLRDGGNDLVWSVAGTVEIAIQVSTGRMRLPRTVEALVEGQRQLMDLEILPIEHRHAVRMATLPLVHRDPFDRILVAQAQSEGLALISSDTLLRRYGVEVIW